MTKTEIRIKKEKKSVKDFLENYSLEEILTMFKEQAHTLEGELKERGLPNRAKYFTEVEQLLTDMIDKAGFERKGEVKR